MAMVSLACALCFQSPAFVLNGALSWQLPHTSSLKLMRAPVCSGCASVFCGPWQFSHCTLASCARSGFELTRFA